MSGPVIIPGVDGVPVTVNDLAEPVPHPFTALTVIEPEVNPGE